MRVVFLFVYSRSAVPYQWTLFFYCFFLHDVWSIVLGIIEKVNFIFDFGTARASLSVLRESVHVYFPIFYLFPRRLIWKCDDGLRSPRRLNRFRAIPRAVRHVSTTTTRLRTIEPADCIGFRGTIEEINLLIWAYDGFLLTAIVFGRRSIGWTSMFTVWQYVCVWISFYSYNFRF